MEGVQPGGLGAVSTGFSAGGRERLRASWGDFLGRYDWDWFATLTFAELVCDRLATARFRSWMRRLKARDPYWFLVHEIGSIGGRLHLHALVGGVRSLSRKRAWGEWFEWNGRARVEPYDPSRGASGYCGKYLAKEREPYWEIRGRPLLPGETSQLEMGL